MGYFSTYTYNSSSLSHICLHADLYNNSYAYRSQDQTNNENYYQDKADNENYYQDDPDTANRYQVKKIPTSPYTPPQLLNTDTYPSLIFFTTLLIMGWGLLFSYP
jgi:hypothetical protein